MASGDLWVTRSCIIPEDELEWRFTGSGGPGGQHANTANTKAEVRFSVESSAALGPRQRARLLEKLGPVVRVAASDRRSQAQNRALALERLRARLADALKIEPPRHETKPSRSSKVKRVEAKRKHSQLKRSRSARPSTDD